MRVSSSPRALRSPRSIELRNAALKEANDQLQIEVEGRLNQASGRNPYPELERMDAADSENQNPPARFHQPTNLKQVVDDVRNRMAADEALFYDDRTIRCFLAGLAMSRLHLLQGISGTGKTSLPRAFAKALGGHADIVAVQAGWRDRQDLLGYYNAFDKKYHESSFVKALYAAQCPTWSDRLFIVVLDEMNLSRPEQYFAEFLSALEKNDPRDRLISLSESQLPNAPALLVEGRRIRVPHNVWFVGTANHDETTNEFADKTYDRAHVMTLPRHEAGFKVEPKPKASFSYGSLMERFDAAVTQNADEVSELLAELTTGPLTSILQDRFDLGWGNRLERQAMRFVPVYMAAGGRKEDALDHLLASRVFRRGKVTGRYDATIDDLAAIEQALTTVWKGWKSEPRRSIALLAEDRRRKERGA